MSAPRCMAARAPAAAAPVAVCRPPGRGQPARPRASSAAAPSAAPPAAAELTARLRALAGSQYGHDLDASRRAEVEAVCAQLAALDCAEPSAAPGETWRPLYTNSTGNSSGKLGPFITDVEQIFPADEPGIYYNVSRLGPITAQLRGKCAVSGRRVNLEFENVSLRLGPWQVSKKDWAPGQMRGHWAAEYWDADTRVFKTNKGSLFVMVRKD